MLTLTEATIIQRLSKAQKSKPATSSLWDFITDEPRPAAVLIPLFITTDKEQNESWNILLTRRTDTVEEHQGQVAFPGGRADPTDTTPEMTALREAHEEIGLDPLQVKILGRMNSLYTISNYLVTPIVGVIPWPFPMQLEESEVSHVFSIPLDWLADKTHYEIRNRPIPEILINKLGKGNHQVIFFQPYQGEILWGVSAQIMVELINILYEKKLAGD